jgi:hypothetical protein
LIRLLGMAVSVAWILIVGANYTALFVFPGPPNIYTGAPIPPDLAPAYLPLLAATLILGIIRQLTRSRCREPHGPG